LRGSGEKRISIGRELFSGAPTRRETAFVHADFPVGPIFEEDFEDSAYGHRPRRSAADAGGCWSVAA